MGNVFETILHLEIWHDYYLGQSDVLDKLPAQYNISDVVSLVPTLECQKTLRQLRWLFRPQPYGAVLLAYGEQTEEPQSGSKRLKPFVPIDVNTRLTFWMVVRDRNFSNYTNLSLTKPRNHIYYFSNLSDNPSDNQLFLTTPLKPYEAGAEYQFGQLVDYPSNQDKFTLEALEYEASAPEIPELISYKELKKNDKKEPAKWLSLPNSQYVSEQDHRSSQGLSRTQTIAKANPGEHLQFSLQDLNGRETLILKRDVPDDHADKTPFSVNLNFSGQQPGYYQLLLNQTPIDDFILFDPLVARDAFALIELSLNPATLPSSSRLLENKNGVTLLQANQYCIRFKNRSTLWRYHSTPARKFEPKILPSYLKLLNENQTSCVTKYPHGLYHQPKYLLSDGTNKSLPVPQGQAMITPDVKAINLPDDQSKKVTQAIFSDIYL